jgi:Uma2 family endonuclease
MMLKELGFKSRPELTLAIDESWEPRPDVGGILGPEEDPYPTPAVAVAIEVLSPEDRFTRVIQKCRKCSQTRGSLAANATTALEISGPLAESADESRNA